MRILRFTSLFLGLAIVISCNRVVAQQDFGELLLQAFTTGALPSSNQVDPDQSTMPEGFPSDPLEPIPHATPEELSELQGTAELEFNELMNTISEQPTSLPIPVDASSIDENIASGNQDEIVFQLQSSSSPLPSLAPNPTSSPSISPSPSQAIGKEDTAQTSAEASVPQMTAPSQTNEPDPIANAKTTPQPEIGESLIQSLEMPTNESDFSTAIFSKITVNCGGVEERSPINEGKTKWYNVDSQIAEDPYAAANFVSRIDAMLYSSYRYATAQVTYRVDLPAPGRWMVVLQWAEISHLYMREGARVFSVGVLGAFKFC
eukprot:gb/GEZJ01004906.1/.p1 GENE.gb/GEZJ01004906.1/~~gb/GEZJ01004906.1/.p1  ORF type:complete len:318 (+),score=52.12 gb/GEZJ01004906.1/:1115-2068(+)